MKNSKRAEGNIGGTINASPKSPLSAKSGGGSSHGGSFDLLPIDYYAIPDANNGGHSMEQLYNAIYYEMRSSDQSHSPSMRSYTTFGNESRIDGELNRLVGGVYDRDDQVPEENEVEAKNVLKELVVPEQSVQEAAAGKASVPSSKKMGVGTGAGATTTTSKDKGRLAKMMMPSRSMAPPSKTLDKSNISTRSVREKPSLGRKDAKISRRSNSVSSLTNDERSQRGHVDMEATETTGSDNHDLGSYLLKKAMDVISFGDNPKKAFKLALRAKRSFEMCKNGKPNLDFVMCLHLLACFYCRSGEYDQAIPLLERSIEIPKVEMGQTHALAKFASCMMLGDVYALQGQIDNSILFYRTGLHIQRHVLGEKDVQFGETCRYVAEAHVLALQFDEAEKLCQLAVDIHKEKSLSLSSSMSLEEASDHRLMGLICGAKADHETSLQHYVLASMAMQANGQDTDKAAIDCNIGDAHLSMTRYDEAVLSYQKGLAVLKTSKGENHPAVASVYVRLAELYNKIGKFRESKSYCEIAQYAYENPPSGIPAEEIASGLVNLAAIYESMQELEQALSLLQKGLATYSKSKRQQHISSIMAGIEAQMGAIAYMLGRYSDSYKYFKSAVAKFQGCGEKKTGLCGIALNQMGLACVHLCEIAEAAGLFEKARDILKLEYGPYHPDTLAVYSNLAGAYDAIGRWDDAIEILEFIVEVRQEKLGTADPIVDEEKRRLAALLKEAGRARNRKSWSLENLLDNNSQVVTKISHQLI